MNGSGTSGTSNHEPDGAVDEDAQLDEWFERLRACGQRLTAPRRTILRAALHIGGPFTAEDLLAEARREDRMISLATVYRTLGLVEEAGILRKVDTYDGDERRHYEVDKPGEPRAVLECQDCGATVPLDAACLDLRERYLVKQLGFAANQISLRIRAACERNRREGFCEKSARGSDKT
ncbi:MAG: Fur family transcriptional regulator [Opitutales bacterium]